MRSSIITLLIVVATLFLFIVPQILRILDTGRPPSPLGWTLLILGVVVLAALTVWREHLARRGVQKELEQKDRELEQHKKHLSDQYIEDVLGQTVRILKIPPIIRIVLYLENQETGRLYIAYHIGLSVAREQQMEFEPLRGWVGHVWDTGDQISYELTGRDEKEIRRIWKFHDDQYATIRRSGVQSVLYTPVVRPTDLEIIGVLGLECTHSYSQSRFDTPEVQNEVSQLATILGRILHESQIV